VENRGLSVKKNEGGGKYICMAKGTHRKGSFNITPLRKLCGILTKGERRNKDAGERRGEGVVL